MKTMTKAFGLLVFGGLLPLTAEVTESKTETTTTAGGTTTTETTTTTTFNPEVRTKVVKYFETYKSDPYGLPPTWTTQFKVKEIPSTWRTTIAPGLVITEKERPYLVKAPPELISVLPSPAADVHYYVAGSNVVAVDKTYKVVDSVTIPSIKIKVDD